MTYVDTYLQSMTHMPVSVKARNGVGSRARSGRDIGDATVLFADIAGFVQLSRELGDETTFDVLDRLVCEFDVLCDWHGVEKVKTVGDGYMAVSKSAGQTNHAERVVRLALDMLEAAERVGGMWGIEISLRVGIASGPVVAGSMGLNKRTHDFWGSTVNLASRLEGEARCGTILISDDCRALLDDCFVVRAEGIREIRGVGETAVWQLEGEREIVVGFSSIGGEIRSGVEPH